MHKGETVKVAVYGSLKKGFHNHYILGDSEYVEEKYIDGYIMYSLGSFPGAFEGEGKIHVEIYEVSDNLILEDLDMLEGHPNFYKRVDKGEFSIYILQRNIEDYSMQKTIEKW
jgi:gamma-glutamylcyclotransferase (GGCT)/AIG2-like uncharacterized protein YtfP